MQGKRGERIIFIDKRITAIPYKIAFSEKKSLTVCGEGILRNRIVKCEPFIAKVPFVFGKRYCLPKELFECGAVGDPVNENRKQSADRKDTEAANARIHPWGSGVQAAEADA